MRREEALLHRGPAQHSYSLASQFWKDGVIKRSFLGNRGGPGQETFIDFVNEIIV